MATKQATEIDFDFDFGFTSASEDEIKAPIIKDLQPAILIAAQGYQQIIDNLLKSIEPLLNNLVKDADTKEYIYWPDRKAKIEAYRKKLHAIANGS